MEYFNVNWHDIRLQWVEGLKRKSLNLLNSTTNRVECINQKLKSVISKHSGMVTFFTDLMVILRVLETERRHRAMRIVHKSSAHLMSSDQQDYSAIVTPFAMKHISRQMAEAQKCSSISHETSSDACSCGFTSSMGLPCKHIFRFRMNLGVKLFDEALILNQWKMSYFMQNLNWKEPAELGASSSIGVLPVQRDLRQPLSQQAKYRKAFIVAQRIAALVSEATGLQFEHLLSMLVQFEDSLKSQLLSTHMQPIDIVELLPDRDEVDIDDPDCPTFFVESRTGVHPLTRPSAEVKSNTATLVHNDVPVSTEETRIDLNMIQMPPRIPRCGRPKGAETTVIGLPKKRKLATPKLLPFSKTPPADKDKMLLKWLIKPDVLPAVLSGEQLIEIADVIPWLRIPTKVTEEPVEISRVRRYFSSDSWSYLTKKLEFIKKRNLWLCQACDNEISGAFVICCDHCLNWYDRKCVGLKTEPKSKTWFCKGCLKKE